MAKKIPVSKSSQNDSLLDELNGTGVTLTRPDGVPAQSPTSADRLDVSPAPATGPSVKKSDAVHATFAGGQGYRVVVVGDYYAPSADSKGKIVKRYELAFNLPSLESALGKIVGKLLVPALQKRYPGALGYRTHEIKSAEPLTPDTPPTNSLQFMDRERLVRYIEDNGVPIRAADYQDVVVLRDAVIDHKLNPKGFEEREARKQAERKEFAELQAMNPDLTAD